MGGGKGGGTNWDYVAGQNAYNAAKSGQSSDAIMAAMGDKYAAAGQEGINRWQSEQQSNALFESLLASLMAPQDHSQTNDYAAQLEAQKAEAARIEEENRRTEGINKRNEMFGSYSDAAEAAIKYVDAEINNERANAALLGVDYAITDDQRTNRVNDYFSTLWSESDQSTLEKLQGEWGDPEGFEGFTVTRGTGSTYADKQENTQLVSVSKGKSGEKLPSLLEEEDALLGV